MEERDSDDSAESPLIESDVDADETICHAVLHSVATVSGTEIARLPTLYDAVDPDALDAFFSRLQADGAVRFAYAGYTIVVCDNGTVAVYDAVVNE